jgi:hypothetical protein
MFIIGFTALLIHIPISFGITKLSGQRLQPASWASRVSHVARRKGGGDLVLSIPVEKITMLQVGPPSDICWFVKGS